jgi:hypothetical protein
MKSTNNQSIETFLPLRPHMLISLADMIQFCLHEFVIRWEDLLVLKRHYENIGIAAPGALVMPEDFFPLNSLALQLKAHCEMLKIPKSADRLWRFENRLESGICTNSIIMAELQEIYNLINCEMNYNYFAFIPAAKISYFEKEKLFGENVFEKFPNSRDDIKAAGNCLAVDLYDAAVFHLMLVMNNGLLALARHIDIPVGKRPLEYEEWNVLIRNIDTKLDDIAKAVQNNQIAGTIKDSDLDFYQGLLDNLKYTKDAHRNPIAHARGDYDESKAVAVFNDVRRFMERLAMRVSES